MAKTNRELADLIGILGHHEREVIEWVIEGLAQGRHVYGELNLGTDRRSWRVEAMQEIRDALVYAACQAICLGEGGRGTSEGQKARTEQPGDSESEWASLAKGTLP